MIHSYTIRISLIIAALCLCCSRCKHTPPEKTAYEPPVIKVGYVDLKNRIDSARAKSESVAAKINAELERLSREKSQQQIQVVHPLDGHIYLQNQNTQKNEQ